MWKEGKEGEKEGEAKERGKENKDMCSPNPCTNVIVPFIGVEG